jgi:hypothetical protein
MTRETFEHEVCSALSRIEQKQDDLRQELLGDHGRIIKIEDSLSWNDKKQWIHSAVIVPIVSVIVGAAKKMGWI